MRPQVHRQQMFTIFGAFAILVGLLLIAIPPLKMPFTVVSAALAATASLQCAFWATTRLLPPGELPEVGVFQTNMLISLAAAEFVMLAGTFVGSGSMGPLPFALLSWGLMFGLILPKVIRYWKLVESRR